MPVVAEHLYLLPTQPTVKWLATQERNISKDLAYPDFATETPEEYVLRTYLQFLWLPQVRRHIHSVTLSQKFHFCYFLAHFRRARPWPRRVSRTPAMNGTHRMPEPTVF